MVSSANFAKSPACLRYQLCDVIFGTHRRPRVDVREGCFTQQLSRAISATGGRHQESIANLADRESCGPRQQNDVHSRIIGRPGRRQRVVSAQLKTASLDRPSNVVILQDVKDMEGGSGGPGAGQRSDRKVNPITPAMLRTSPWSVTAKEIEKSVANSHLAPEEEEIFTTIESVRPSSAVVEAGEFAALLDKLCKSYTLRQLSRYLVTRFEQSTADQSIPEHPEPTIPSQALPCSGWQPGRTPIDGGRARKVRNRRSNTKAAIVDQILRSTWKIRVQSEEQALGELDLALRPLQMAILLDLTPENKPNYHRILPQFLIDASEIQPYWPRNILRITARRQDAEEILERITFALTSVQPFDFDLKEFENTLISGQRKLQGWQIHRAICTHVSKATGSLLWIDTKANRIVKIYSFSKSEQNVARRLLLANLEFRRSRSLDRTCEELPISQNCDQGKLSEGLSCIPWIPLGGLTNVLYRTFDLSRTIVPKLQPQTASLDSEYPVTQTAAEVDAGLSKEMAQNAAYVTTQLDQSPPLSSHYSHDPTTSERGLVNTGWSVEFCHILRANTLPLNSNKGLKVAKNPKDLKHDPSGRTDLQHPEVDQITNDVADHPKSNPVIVCPQVPGIEAFASYLKPAQEVHYPFSEIVIHMIPSPSELRNVQPSRNLPQVEARFRKTSEGVFFNELKFVLDEQVVRTPLPAHAVDMQFKRQLLLIRSRTDCIDDKRILDLERCLSQQAEHQTEQIITDAETMIRIPQWLIAENMSDVPGLDSIRDEYIEMPYLLARIETSHTRFLKPNMEPNTPSDLPEGQPANMTRILPKNQFFIHQVVEGGAIISRYSSLRLASSQPTSEDEDKVPLEGSKAESTKDDASSPDTSQKLVSTAFLAAGLLTSASTGTLPLLYHPS